MNKVLIFTETLLLIVSTSLNVAMIRANRNLANRAEAFRSELAIPNGVVMPDLRGVDLAGKPAVIPSQNPSHPTVIFVFSPTCPSCVRNWSNWTSILSSQSRDLWRPLFINVGPPTTPEFRRLHGLDHYETLDKIDKGTIYDYRIYRTPMTIVLTSSGKVAHAWDGQLSQSLIGSFSQKLLDQQ